MEVSIVQCSSKLGSSCQVASTCLTREASHGTYRTRIGNLSDLPTPRTFPQLSLRYLLDHDNSRLVGAVLDFDPLVCAPCLALRRIPWPKGPLPYPLLLQPRLDPPPPFVLSGRPLQSSPNEYLCMPRGWARKIYGSTCQQHESRSPAQPCSHAELLIQHLP